MSNKEFKTPILLIAWRRPKETNEVINSLRKIKPKNLFISCDGAREGNEEEFKKVKKTRNILKQNIDWDCEINWQVSDTNLGCKKGVSNAISWFFKNVNEGIIIEDDIIAHKDFFEYCQNLLKFLKIFLLMICKNNTGVKFLKILMNLANLTHGIMHGYLLV